MSGQSSATNMKAAFGVAAAITTSPAGLPAQFLTATKRGGTQRRSRGFAASSLVVSIAARTKASIISPAPETGYRYSAQPGCCTRPVGAPDSAAHAPERPQTAACARKSAAARLSRPAEIFAGEAEEWAPWRQLAIGIELLTGRIWRAPGSVYCVQPGAPQAYPEEMRQLGPRQT